MAQIHFYIPDSVEQKLRDNAQKENLPLSRYVARIVTQELKREHEWPPDYFQKVFGEWEGEVLERPPQGDYEKREEL